MDKRRRWIAVLLEEGLRLGILEPADILRYATPAVLATDLPPPLVARVLEAGIGSEAFSPELVIKTLGPATLAEHVPPSILWGSIDELAKVIIAEHPLSQHHGEAPSSVLEPATSAHGDDMPEIEVLDG
jgi:hypothetical protein